MSIVGEATGVIGLLGKAWNLLRNRLDPTRGQAKRLIASFEAYGIARQQIPRLLPAGLKLPNAAFSTAGEPRAATEAVGHGAQRGVLKVVSLSRGVR